MKTLIALAVLFILASCQEEKGIWDTLTPAEQAAVRAQAIAECKSSNQVRFDALKNSTTFFQSTSWARNKAYKHELKNGDTVDTLNEIQVWKQDTVSNVVYLWVKQTKGSDLTSFFVRITKTQHQDMVDDLLDDLCDKNITATTSTNPITISKNYTQTVTPNKREFSDTYSYQTDETPFIATTYRLTRKIVTKVIADDSVVSTTNLSSTFSTVADPVALGSNPDSYATIYCDLETPATRFGIPYTYSCVTSLPGTWNLTI